MRLVQEKKRHDWQQVKHVLVQLILAVVLVHLPVVDQVADALLVAVLVMKLKLRLVYLADLLEIVASLEVDDAQYGQFC